jgi:hypothetical protein
MAVGDVPLTPIIDTVTGSVTEIGRIFLRTLTTAVGALAPIDASYWVSRGAAVLTADVNLGALPSGYLKIASAVGIATPATVASIPQTDVTGLTAALAGKATLPIAQADVTGLIADLASKAPLASPALTGIPTAPTVAAAANNTQLATTATVQAALAPYAPLASPAFTGTPSTPQLAFPAVQVPSAGPNVLDDYEEGTWMPTLGGTATYSAQSGTYTKIGRLVHVTGTITVNAIGTGSPNTISGLPFPIAFFNAPGIIGYFSGAAGVVGWAVCIGQGNTLLVWGVTAPATAVGPLNFFGAGTQAYFAQTYETS